jgi:hypothetical protein
MRTYFCIIIFLTLFYSSCSQQKTLEGFDEKAWKADRNACKNQRSELVKILLAKKDELKKFDDDAISDLLGSPERNRQFTKGRKNYIYFLYPGNQCDNDTSKNEGKKLVIEFDPIGNTSMIRESNLDF